MKLFYLLAFMGLPVMAQSNLELLEKLSKGESYGNVLAVYNMPDKETSSSALYSFSEVKLSPQDVLYFYVPENLSARPLSQVGFAHRQKGFAPENDSNPGLTSVLVYTTDLPGDELRYWAGHASGKLGAKFAEYRNSPEFDALYEWPRIGHRGMHSNKSTLPIRPNVIRVQNVGTDNVYFSGLYIETVPFEAQKYETLAFTPKSTFGDPLTMEGRYYGGGQNKRGKFPGALRLTTGGHRTQPQLPANFAVDEHKIFVTLPVGVNISSVDVMCGDTHPDEARNKDGGWGSLGNAGLSIFVENTVTGTRRYLIQDKNVGPQGVISASDVSPETLITAEERLVISNKRDHSTLYIMALRLGLNNVK